MFELHTVVFRVEDAVEYGSIRMRFSGHRYLTEGSSKPGAFGKRPKGDSCIQGSHRQDGRKRNKHEEDQFKRPSRGGLEGAIGANTRVPESDMVKRAGGYAEAASWRRQKRAARCR